jgi:acetyl-CoA carboxylase carboxyl transferase subunit alpha
MDKMIENLSAMERVRLARHPERPRTLDFIERVFSNFVELHGDRRFADDPAVVCGFAEFEGESVAIIGQQKGRDTKQTLKRNFGMPKPEGYRKALRIMKMAEKFGRPILTFIDTPGAYPGIDAEERGQSEAIAFNLREMARLKVPTLVTVIGEGGSGGALAIGVGDRVLMLENAVYSVITPEGCAAILWKDKDGTEEGEERQKLVERAAECLRLTASDLLEMGMIDGVVSEPEGGAHTNYDESAELLKAEISESLFVLKSLQDLEKRRYERLRKLGQWQSV